MAVGPPRHAMSRAQRLQTKRPRRRRKGMGIISLIVLIAVVVGAVFLGVKLWHNVFHSSAADYTGNGKRDLVIQVHAGDSTTAIGQTLQDHNVVASVRAFIDAAHG